MVSGLDSLEKGDADRKEVTHVLFQHIGRLSKF